MSFPPSVLTAEISLILQESSQLKKRHKETWSRAIAFYFRDGYGPAPAIRSVADGNLVLVPQV